MTNDLQKMLNKALETKDEKQALVACQLEELFNTINVSLLRFACLASEMDQPYRKDYCKEAKEIRNKAKDLFERFAADYGDKSKHRPLTEDSKTIMLNLKSFETLVIPRHGCLLVERKVYEDAVNENPDEIEGVVFLNSKEEGDTL